MHVYIYQAALLCRGCGDLVCEQLNAAGKRPEDVLDESSYDSDDYPKGPYRDGGGEADCPQHCDHCQCALDNPLTSDGIRYVREALAGAITRGSRTPTEIEWADQLRLHGESAPDEFYDLPTRR